MKGGGGERAINPHTKCPTPSRSPTIAAEGSGDEILYDYKTLVFFCPRVGLSFFLIRRGWNNLPGGVMSAEGHFFANN